MSAFRSIWVEGRGLEVLNVWSWQSQTEAGQPRLSKLSEELRCLPRSDGMMPPSEGLYEVTHESGSVSAPPAS